MCGIVGYIGTKREAYPILIKGLQRLEYRGYDSAGVALINKGNELNVYKTKGKVADLEEYCSLGCSSLTLLGLEESVFERLIPFLVLSPLE